MTKNSKPELLSPAGDINAGYAALHYGADAVYLGLSHFSARASATNFDADTLNHFTGYAHSLGKKVFVAINTLIKQNEIPSLITELETCQFCQVDAIIIQDLGVANIISSYFPSLTKHASTQMTVHNPEGAKALQKQGFKRVVLARELSLKEISAIASLPNLETEAFIHGALCYSYSGICLFSSLSFGKSANRGKCAYPCRASFTSDIGLQTHPFSMKDMALNQDILTMPVTSLKIEGRKKNALYVAAVTDYYRNILDKKTCDETKQNNIKQIFSRPWTKFNFHGKDKDITAPDFVGHQGLLIGKTTTVIKNKLFFTPNHKIARHDGLQIEIKGQEKAFGFAITELKTNGKNTYEAPAHSKAEITLPSDAPFIPENSNIYLASSSSVKGGYPYHKPNPQNYKTYPTIDISIEIQKTKITANSNNCTSEIIQNFNIANNPSATSGAVKEVFSKTGDYPFSVHNINLENPNNLFVPKSILNTLRKELYCQIHLNPTNKILPNLFPQNRQNFQGFIIKTNNLSNLELIDFKDKNIAEIIYVLPNNPNLTLSDLNKIPKNKVRLCLPTIAKDTNFLNNHIKTLLSLGYKKWEISNYWGLEVLPSQGIDLTFSEQIYMMNTYAIRQAKELKATRTTLSVEDNLSNMQTLCELSELPLCVIAYQDIPLFTSDVCMNNKDCQHCSGKSPAPSIQKIKNQNQNYNLLIQNCQTVLLNEQAFCISEFLPKIPASFYRIDFLYKPYTSSQIKDIFTMIQAFKPLKNTTTGNITKEI